MKLDIFGSLRHLALIFAVSLSGTATAFAQSGEKPDRSAWAADVVAAMESLPIQDEGRIKPFLSFAKQKLTRISGRSSYRIDEDTKISAVEWMLDVLFRPSTTFDDRVFLVPSKEVLDAIELPHEGKKMRDRYSYNELVPARRKLYELTDRYRKMRERKKDLPLVTGQIVTLGNDFYYYERLANAMGAFAKTYDVEGETLQKLLGGEKVRASVIAKHGVELNRMLAKELEEVSEDESTPLRRLILSVLNTRARTAAEFTLFPPADKEKAEWFAAGPLLDQALRGKGFACARADLLVPLERLSDGPKNVTAADVVSMRDTTSNLARERGEYAAVPYELHLENVGYLHWVRGLFFIALLLVAVLWWKPQAKWYGRVVYAVAIVPLLMITSMVVMRCIIRYHNPSTDILAPVTNLYETIPFITIIGGAILLFVEYYSKNRIALTLAIVLGFGGSQLALSYAPLDGGDTLSPLQAVLISNFWLLTHVQVVTIGYAASLLAALLAHVWLVGRLVVHLKGIKAPSTVPFLKSTMRMCYGAVAFGLVFSVVGTILGGIWANYSWGRFWGWDPKENGALMICLWQIMMLHTRIGGFVRHFGFAFQAVVLGMITVFSWWHVNQLGVGLHSYGFTDGVLLSLWIFYGIETMFLLGALACRGVGAMGRAAQERAEAAQPVGGESAVKAQDRLE